MQAAGLSLEEQESGEAGGEAGVGQCVVLYVGTDEKIRAGDLEEHAPSGSRDA